MSEVMVLPAVAALLISLAATALAMAGGVLDFPNERSSHDRPTPRAGGLGVVAGLGAGALIAAFQGFPASGVAPLLAAALAFAGLGLADDLLGLGSLAKFAMIAVLSVLVAQAVGPVDRIALTLETGVALPAALALAGSALFVFVVVNATNFMDGSNGMLAAVMIPAGAALGVAGLVAGAGAATLAGLVLAAAMAGFIPFNAPRAQVFAGDAGSLAAGAVYAAGALAMAGQGFSGSLWLAPLFVLAFIGDVLLTLLKRAAGGRFSLSAHREHAYQMLLRAGWSHPQVAVLYGVATIGFAAGGLVAAQGPDGAVPAAFGVSVLVWIGIYAWIHQVARRRGVDQ
ncbi:hypothetical protein DDZ18_08120 [Marinicauda salina]|uniref:Uncharacterized protein n=1 Tax=Marinicauda salina TaxID=2135793 RepID=A0A2U2BUE5_9PROT|nr:hypothetical protein [Marinicauda salina]PWE17622.1 hypothetical protein DDZ18_08120 [Marinicauda salina]